MFLLVGLGNPGDQFKNTRHNIGREIVYAFQKKHALEDFRFEKKWNARVLEGKVEKEKVALLLPDTMMNNSGKAVAPAARFFKIKPAHILVFHDDADIALGNAKLSFGKNAAGHKGVESLIRALKTKDFWRFRIGIAGLRDIPAEKLVLKKFTPAEQASVKKLVKKTVETAANAIQDTPELAMNTYNR